MQERSEAQKQASRENGKLSRGPVTPAGKRRSSQNALRHGLCAKVIVLDNERKGNYLEILSEFSDRFKPQDSFDKSLVEDMAASHWRMRRAMAVQTNIVNESMPAAASGDAKPFTAQMNRTSASLKRDNRTSVDSAVRHEARYQIAIQRSLRTFILARTVDKLVSQANLSNQPDTNSPAKSPETPEKESPSAGPQA
jgi:hypothetical protein